MNHKNKNKFHKEIASYLEDNGWKCIPPGESYCQVSCSLISHFMSKNNLRAGATRLINFAVQDKGIDTLHKLAVFVRTKHPPRVYPQGVGRKSIAEVDEALIQTGI